MTRDLRAHVDHDPECPAVLRLWLGDLLLRSTTTNPNSCAYFGELAEQINALLDARVTELLAANNREVERRREAEEEIAYWRADALARLQMATWLHRGCMQRGKEARAADIRVSTIRPTLAALESADARDFYERCALCGEEVRPGAQVVIVAIGDPEDRSMACAKHDPDSSTRHVYQHDPAEKIIADA